MLLLRHLPKTTSTVTVIVTRPRTFHNTPAFCPKSRITLDTFPSRIQQQHFSSATMASTDATLRAFFQASKYAVVGASSNTQKYGYKVFKWYLTHDLPVTPINPGSPAIEVDGKEYATVKSLSELQEPAETSVSIITPPAVTLRTLEEAKGLGISAVFLQPGTFNDDVLAYARENFKTVVGGDGGAGSEGWCVLVDGERGLRAAGKL